MPFIKGGLEGITPGSNVTIGIAQNAKSASRNFSTYGLIGLAAGVMPLIAGPQFDGDTATVDTSQLTNVTSIKWRVRGGADLGTSATQDLTGLAESFVEVVTVSDEGVRLSPPIFVYTPMMMMDHNEMDALMLALMPHNDATNVAVQDGDWSNASTWSNGVPVADAKVLTPNGISVRYDVDAGSTLIRSLRVDGEFHFATDVSTHLYVRDIIGAQQSEIYIGNSKADRVQSNVQAAVTFEGDSTLDVASDPQLFSRGIITNGALYIYGQEKLNHSLSEPALIDDASVILFEPPTGWGVGDEIIIGGTSATLPIGDGVGMQDVAEDEIVTITGFGPAANEVQFSPPLIHDHNQQNTRTARTDIYPMVQLRANSRNIIIQSENTASVDRMGHIMVMHSKATFDCYDFSLINMGRTDSIRPIGDVDENGLFKFHNGTDLVTEPFTATSNKRGRYAFHAHLVGYGHEANGRPVPTVYNATVEISPRWGFGHHDCEMNIFNSSTFRVVGCGFVAEQGGELGVWDNLSAMQATKTNTATKTLSGSTKGLYGSAGRAGDLFQFAMGFGYRGRSVKMTRCIATSCAWGHSFFHRTFNANEVLFTTSTPPRERMDLKEVGLANVSVSVEPDEWTTNDYPIIHFTDCGAIACLNGIHILKELPNQNHDYNVILKSFFSKGTRVKGAFIEYVGTYILQDFDIIMGKEGFSNGIGQTGIDIGNNMFQIALVRCRVDGSNFGGLRISSSAVSMDSDLFDAPTDPRFWVIGYEDRGNNQPGISGPFEGTKTLQDVSTIVDDFQMDYINYDLDPTDTFTNPVGILGSTGLITTAPTNTDGLKFGNHPNGIPVAPKTWGDGMFDINNAEMTRNINARGYSEFGGSDVYVQRDIISDVLTGRISKKTYLWESSAPLTIGVNNGGITMSAPVTAPDLELTVAPNGSVTFNALTGAAGGTGSFEIDDGDFTAPDYGKLSINYDTGMVTYTPYEGLNNKTDFGYLNIRSVRDTGATQTETEIYGTKKIKFLITDNATISAPVPTTEFTIAGASGAINVTTLKRPSSGGRRILGTLYSTDNGGTWRRLCNGYPLTVESLTVDSAGAALTAQSYDVRLKYKTDHEPGDSPETADINVTVT